MMESVALPGGGGVKAAVRNYRVAIKTGTAKKSMNMVSMWINTSPIPQALRLPAIPFRAGGGDQRSAKRCLLRRGRFRARFQRNHGERSAPGKREARRAAGRF